MGGCGTKSKEHRNKNKNNGDKYQERETNDNNQGDFEEYVIPTDFDQKIEFLCSQKLNKHIRMRYSDTSFFYKVIAESNITNYSELEKAITYIREKIRQKNDSIMRNVDTKGSVCIQVISEYHNKIKDSDFKGLLAMCLQEKCIDNQIPALIESVFTVSVKCYQIVLTILLCSDQESIDRWWNINKDNQNITEEFYSELKEYNKSLSIKNEQHQQLISMLLSRRTTLQKGLMEEQIKQSIHQNPDQVEKKQETHTRLYQEFAQDYLANLYGSAQNQDQENNKKASPFDQIKSNEDIGARPIDNYYNQHNNNRNSTDQRNEAIVPQQLKEYVSSYLTNLYKNVIDECQYTENINDYDFESNHKASACLNYSTSAYVKRRSAYLSKKD